jgi:hypothetical protein
MTLACHAFKSASFLSMSSANRSSIIVDSLLTLSFLKVLAPIPTGSKTTGIRDLLANEPKFKLSTKILINSFWGNAHLPISSLQDSQLS